MAESFYRLALKEIKNYFLKIDSKTRFKILAALVGALVLGPFVIYPAWVTRWQNQEKIRNLHQQIGFAKLQIQSEPKLLEEERVYESFIQETRTHLFTEGEIQRLLGILTEIGQRSKVALLSSQPQVNTPKIPDPFDKEYQAHSYVLTLEGGYHALAAFVSEIENYSKIIRVDQFLITEREETPGVQVGEIHLSVFLKKE